jgi:phosphohistidine phosphatase
MRQLLLLRHAKSSWADPAQSDHARPLNSQGRQAAAAVREALRELGLVPDVVLVSSARRTLQTLEALSPWDETPIIEPMNGLYLASATQILQLVRGVSQTVRSLMVVGHNPGLHDLAMALVGAHAMSSNGNMTRKLAEGFPAAALAEFTIARTWQDLGEGGGEGGGRLVRFLCPRDLPEMAN